MHLPAFSIHTHQRKFLEARSSDLSIIRIKQDDKGTMPQKSRRRQAHTVKIDLDLPVDLNSLRSCRSPAVDLHIRNIAFRCLDIADLFRDPRDVSRADQLVGFFNLHIIDPTLLSGQSQIGIAGTVGQRKDHLPHLFSVTDVQHQMVAILHALQFIYRAFLSDQSTLFILFLYYL